jgi:hypothetical protein
VVNFTPRPLYPRGKSPWYPLDRRLGRPSSRSGRFGGKKNLDPAGIPTPTPWSSSLCTSLNVRDQVSLPYRPKGKNYSFVHSSFDVNLNIYKLTAVSSAVTRYLIFCLLKRRLSGKDGRRFLAETKFCHRMLVSIEHRWKCIIRRQIIHKLGEFDLILKFSCVTKILLWPNLRLGIKERAGRSRVIKRFLPDREIYSRKSSKNSERMKHNKLLL